MPRRKTSSGSRQDLPDPRAPRRWLCHRRGTPRNGRSSGTRTTLCPIELSFRLWRQGNGTMSPVRILWHWFPIAVEEKLCSLLLRSEASATGFEAGSLPHCVCVCVTPSCVRHLVQSKASPKCWQFSRGRRLRFGTDPSTSRRRPLRRRRRRYDITTTDGTGWTRCGPGTSTRRHTTPNPPTVSFTSRTTSTTRTRDELKIRLLTRPVNVTLMGCARGHVSSLLCRLISRPSRLGRKRYGSTTYFFLLWYCSCVTCEGNKSFHIVGS